MARIRTFAEFYEFYLTEHANPRSRAFHFVGTTIWFAACLACSVRHPARFGLSAALFLGLVALGASQEPIARSRSLACGALAMLVGIAGDPLFAVGVAFAYGGSWAGHFFVERNKPAAFQYPVWSFLSDLRMWSQMARAAFRVRPTGARQNDQA